MVDFRKLLFLPEGCSAFLVYYEDVLVYFTAAASPEEAVSFACSKFPDLATEPYHSRVYAVKLTEKRYHKNKIFIARLGDTLKYMVFVRGKAKGIRDAKSAAQVKAWFCYCRKDVDPEQVTVEIWTHKLHRKHHRAIESARQQEESLAVPWQPTLFGQNFGGSKPTWAKTQARAGCNRWYVKKKKFEHPTTPETIALYHDGVSAHPLFGFPTKRVHPSQRKAHHGKQPGKQPELILDHHR